MNSHRLFHKFEERFPYSAKKLFHYYFLFLKKRVREISYKTMNNLYNIGIMVV